MNHPNPEELVPYLFGESQGEGRQALKTHLKNCPECRERLSGWEQGIKRLDVWKLPEAKRPTRLFPMLKWAVAAAFLLLAGFIAGRLSPKSVDIGELRANLEAGIRQEISQELRTIVHDEVQRASSATVEAAGRKTEQLVATYFDLSQAQRLEDRRVLESVVERLESQRVSDLASLKRELDTLAVNTDAGLRHTAAGLAELANYRASPEMSNPTEKSTR